jgi:hypothetical protein
MPKPRSRAIPFAIIETTGKMNGGKSLKQVNSSTMLKKGTKDHAVMRWHKKTK